MRKLFDQICVELHRPYLTVVEREILADIMDALSEELLANECADAYHQSDSRPSRRMQALLNWLDDARVPVGALEDGDKFLFFDEVYEVQGDPEHGYAYGRDENGHLKSFAEDCLVNRVLRDWSFHYDD